MMKKRRVGINIYFVVAALVVFCSCKTGSLDRNAKKYSTLRLHLEEKNPASPQPVVMANIYRENPIDIQVLSASFLDERYVVKATVVDTVIKKAIKSPDLATPIEYEPVETGGFELRIEFDRTGRMLLENVTGAFPGRRVAIFSQFGEEGDKIRWLSAPTITGKIGDGRIQFTPDASREEAERIASGLNLLAKKLKTGKQ